MNNDTTRSPDSPRCRYMKPDGSCDECKGSRYCVSPPKYRGSRSPDSQPAPEQPEEWQPLGPYAQVRVQPSPALSDKQEAERECYCCKDIRAAEAIYGDGPAAPQAKSAPSSETPEQAVARISREIEHQLANLDDCSNIDPETLALAEKAVAALARRATAGTTAPDVCAEMRALCSACGGTGDVHSIDGEWRGSCDCEASAWSRAGSAAAPGDLTEVGNRLAGTVEVIAPAITNAGTAECLKRLAAEWREVASTARAAPLAGRGPRYTCIGKGGDYELIGEARGAGSMKLSGNMAVYRDTANGVLYYRATHDFNSRMSHAAPSPASQAASQVGEQKEKDQ